MAVAADVAGRRDAEEQRRQPFDAERSPAAARRANRRRSGRRPWRLKYVLIGAGVEQLVLAVVDPAVRQRALAAQPQAVLVGAEPAPRRSSGSCWCRRSGLRAGSASGDRRRAGPSPAAPNGAASFVQCWVWRGGAVGDAEREQAWRAPARRTGALTTRAPCGTCPSPCDRADGSERPSGRAASAVNDEARALARLDVDRVLVAADGRPARSRARNR